MLYLFLICSLLFVVCWSYGHPSMKQLDFIIYLYGTSIEEKHSDTSRVNHVLGLDRTIVVPKSSNPLDPDSEY